MALFSKELATIRKNVPIKISLKDLIWDIDFQKAKESLELFHLKSLINRLPGYEPEKGPEQQNLL